MSYHIEVENQQKSIAINKKNILDSCYQILKVMGVQQASLSIVFVTNKTIHSMNRKFLSHDYPTDVITFDLTEGELSRQKKKVKSIDGEIYISAVTAKSNAKEFKTDPQKELVLYLVHGILHLLGYDDHSLVDRKTMRTKEKEVMDFLNCTGPLER